MIKVGVGVSKNVDGYEAGREAAESAIKESGAENLKFTICFASSKFDQKQLLKGITDITKNTPLFGCSSAGEMSSHGFFEGSVSCMTICSDELDVGVGVGERLKEEPIEAGKNSILSALKNVGLTPKTIPPTKIAILTAPDGLSGQEENMLRGITDVVGNNIPLLGGSAGDDCAFKQTFQYCNGKVYTNSVVSAIIKTTIPFSMKFGVGWRPVGKGAFVTKSRGRVCYELDGKPAAERYAELLGVDVPELKKGILAFTKGLINPLAFTDLGGEIWTRQPQAVVEGNALSFFSEVPEGIGLLLCEGKPGWIIESGVEAVKEAINSLPNKEASALIAFSCVSRRVMLDKDAGKETEEINKFTKNMPFIGFYTYGEQGFSKRATIGHKNQTICVLVIGK